MMPSLPPSNEAVRVTIESEAELPSEHGLFRIAVFSNDRDGKEHLAMIRGDVRGAHDVVTRVHSECLTGDVMASLRCDCRAQLERAMRHVGSLQSGIVLYMRQEGRGIGLTNKVRAYRLQESGLDTVDANLALGFREDERDYGIAAAMLAALGVESIHLLTNNPDKVRQLEKSGVVVSQRLPIQVPPNTYNRLYLRAKAVRSGHFIDDEDDEGAMDACA